MEDYYEYLDSNGVTTLYKLIKDDTVALIDSYSVTINGITTTLDTHINDSDIHTPISDIESMVDTKISGLVNSAPETLDTLKELSDALGNDPNFATTVANQIGNKANSVHTHVVKDITDFPTIPTRTSQLINDSGFLTSSSGVITSVSWSDIKDKPNFSTVATSGSYNDLSNKPTIPNVYNKTLTIQKNGTNVATFTSNSNTDVTADITVPTKTSQLTNDSGFLTSSLPIGSYIQFAGSQAPTGFLVCNGSAISRTTYSNLFAVIGTKYGSGNGSTTFNLPNLTDRFLQGSTTSGTVKNAGLPNITGNTGAFTLLAGVNVTSSAFGPPFISAPDAAIQATASSNIGCGSVGLNASLSNSIYGNSSTVQPPALTCLICIKY
ncbi:MAG: tail fiber protein [Lachnospiraceae bacterium]|nr:tail fiber protein [Lachnospiraceae bacterium]MBQ5919415.1 tail fiber protein [Lachnospiraceae bacterium]